jgi:hypothetical protein
LYNKGTNKPKEKNQVTLTKDQIETLNAYNGYELDDNSQDYTESDLEEMAIEEEVREMLLTAINSVYTGAEVFEVYDTEGLVPQHCNNYLLSDDGVTFSGVFVDGDDNEVAFTIVDNNGSWSIKY